jgi:hypothetical protein
VASQDRLDSGNIRSRANQYSARDSDHAFVGADAWPWWHEFNRVVRDQRANDRKIAIRHFQDLWTIPPTLALLLPILAKPSFEHSSQTLMDNIYGVNKFPIIDRGSR